MRPPRLASLLAPALLAIACTPTVIYSTPPDGGASDRPTGLDLAPGLDVAPGQDVVAKGDAAPPADAAATDAPAEDVPPPCRSDRECTARGLVCDLASGRCVECVRDGDCTAANTRCASQRCVAFTPCMSSRTCPGQVCDVTRGFCVDCLSAVDCPAGQTCRGDVCAAMATVCTPNAVTCLDARTQSTCAADGQSARTTVCPGNCSGGMCAAACPAGRGDCDGNAANGCETDTTASTAHCGACGNSCGAAACTAGTCPRLLRNLGGPAGLGTRCLAPSDDGSWVDVDGGTGATSPVDLTPAFPSGLRYFGATYQAMYVNNNGNITFRAALGTYTPTPFPVAQQPMIAPWWGDVDTRGGGQPARNNVCFHLERNRVIVTWDRVGYYASHDDRQNTFQLILTDRTDVRAGDFDVEFRYERCEWTTGDASGGTGGFGGTPAQIGFDAGDQANFLSLPASRTAAIVDVCRTSNVGMPGVWRFTVRNSVIAMGG